MRFLSLLFTPLFFLKVEESCGSDGLDTGPSEPSPLNTSRLEKFMQKNVSMFYNGAAAHIGQDYKGVISGLETIQGDKNIYKLLENAVASINKMVGGFYTNPFQKSKIKASIEILISALEFAKLRLEEATIDEDKAAIIKVVSSLLTESSVQATSKAPPAYDWNWLAGIGGNRNSLPLLVAFMTLRAFDTSKDHQALLSTLKQLETDTKKTTKVTAFAENLQKIKLSELEGSAEYLITWLNRGAKPEEFEKWFKSILKPEASKD